MKREIIIGAVAVAMLAGGAWSVRAELGTDDGAALHEGRGEHGKMDLERRLARMTKVLGLSDAQQSQIKAILTVEREESEPLMEKMSEYRKQLHDAAKASTFDEAAVRAIATNQTQIETELTVSRTRMRSRINAVLTAAQRELAEKLEPEIGRRPRHPGGY